MKPKNGSGTTLGAEHVSLSQRVAEELRRSILTNRRRPGDRLIEDRLSEELGVSRIPIREALRVLAGEGLVAVQPRRGASVEGLNARLAARHHAPEIVQELKRVLKDGNRAARSKHVDDLVRLNGEF